LAFSEFVSASLSEHAMIERFGLLFFDDFALWAPNPSVPLPIANDETEGVLPDKCE
jgi:hypothetical protein